MRNIKYTKEEYVKYAEKKGPKSSKLLHAVMAFVIGGIICVIGQGIIAFCQSKGLDEKVSGNVATITLIFLGALLTGLGIYDNIAKHAGAGSSVPITGFANAIVSAAMEFKAEGLILGLGAKMFAIAGPVIVFGVISSSVWGLIYFLFVK